MRFLHTSDWHLGRIFHGVHLTDDQAHVLDQFVTLVDDAKPDAVLIAGDIYDRSVPPVEAVRLLDEVLSRIILGSGVKVILIAGNHDSPERLGFGTRLLEHKGLYIFSQLTGRLSPVTVYDSHGPVCICPIPYLEPSVVRERLSAPEAADHQSSMSVLANRFASFIPAGSRSIALAHALVTGGEGCDSERPLSASGSGAIDVSCFQPFSFTALGHLHRPQNAAVSHAHYPGSLLKYSFSEAQHKKSVTLVEMDHAGAVKTEMISLSPRRDVRCLEGYLRDILDGPKSGENREDYIMVTLKDSGPVFDAIGKLRQVYPNTLHIERPYLTVGGELRGPGGDHRKLTEADLFSSFFEQVTGEQLSGEQARLFAEKLQSLYHQEREVVA